MQASAIPSKIQLPFANSGTKNAIPVASQISVKPGAASYTDGFPPLTFTDLAAGGVPPSGADFNGILNAITAVQQWQSAGGVFKYDSAFSTAIGGYPAGAVLESADGSTLWMNLADNNTTDPDGANPANWAPAAAYGIAAITGLTNANVTLTPAQYSRPIITLAGTLTGNVQIIFPTTTQEWRVRNNTSGSFTVTCKTAAGTGSTVVQGGEDVFYGDGTNLVQRLGNTPATGDRSSKLATTQMFANEFAASLVSNGKQVLPSGLIIKMGTSGAILANSSLSVTFAEAFPNGVIAAGAFNSYGTAGSTIDTSVGVRYDTNTGITIFNKGTANVTGAPWIAIGY